MRRNLEEYKGKLLIGDVVLPDPFTLDEGWMEETTGNTLWPSLYFCDISEYLRMKTPSELHQRLCNEYKEGKAYRYFSSGWVQHVDFHPISDSSPVCLLGSRVRPSMRTASPYQVWVAIEKDSTLKPGGKIGSAYCTCTAGLQGSCNHIAGVLFRVEYYIRTGLNSKTSTTSVWDVPSQLKPLGEPTPLCEQTWEKGHYFNQDKGNVSSSIQKLATEFTPLSEKQEQRCKAGQHLEELASVLREAAPDSCFVQMFYSVPFPPKEQVKCPPTPLEVAQLLHPHASSEELLKNLNLTEQDRASLSEATVRQAESEQWFEQRRGRITASIFKQVYTKMQTLKKNSNANTESLVKQIMGYKKSPTTVAMKHGSSMEPHAKKAYQKVSRKVHRCFVCSDSGLVVEKDSPCIGCSPDLLVNCKCHGAGLCEIKCPYKIRDEPPSVLNWKHVKEVDGKLVLCKSSSYFAQVQGQMGVLGLSYCDLFVYTAHGYLLERIPFEQDYWNDLLSNLCQFWHLYVAPELLSGFLSADVVPCTGSALDHAYCQQPGHVPVSVPVSASSSCGPLSKSQLPPVYLCGVCASDIEEKPSDSQEESVECTSCHVWCHIVCANLHTIPSDKDSWFCINCQPFTP